MNRAKGSLIAGVGNLELRNSGKEGGTAGSLLPEFLSSKWFFLMGFKLSP
jgi:hypothetical protein